MNQVVALALAGLLAMASVAEAQLPAESAAPLLTGHERLAASLDRIAKGSGLWRTEIEAVRGTGRRAFILTPDQVVVVDPASASSPKAFDTTVLAEAQPVLTGHSRIDAVLVVVNLPLLDRLHDRRGSLPVERDADLDRILVHEVYGHALPYLRAGDTSGRCPDPSGVERAASSCSIARENAVRAELGLGRRSDYTLNGLLLNLDRDATSAGSAFRVRPAP
jgi:hypothetical protein